MTKSKVLFILHLPPPIHGAAKVGEFICQSELLNSSFECDFINLQTSRKLTDTGKGGLSKLHRFVSLYIKVFSALLYKRHELCYMTLNTKGAAFYKEIVVVVLLKLFRKNIVYHFHNKGVSNFQYRFMDNLFYKFAFNNTRSILTSKLLYNDIEKYVAPKDVFYCPNGIPAIINETSFKAESQNPKRFRIIFLSNMIRDKGVWILLEACGILFSRKIDFECHFIGSWGDITENEFLSRVHEKRLSKHIIIHGQKIGKEKWELLLKSDIFAFPSLNDCFPLVLLEAMQCSLPIVSTTEGGIPGIVEDGETGYLIPKENPTELANKLEVLISNPERCLKMGQHGRIRFHKNFTLKTFESNLESILGICITTK